MRNIFKKSYFGKAADPNHVSLIDSKYDLLWQW